MVENKNPITNIHCNSIRCIVLDVIVDDFINMGDKIHLNPKNANIFAIKI